MADLRQRAAEIGWYHTLELGDGVVTDGIFDLRDVVGRYTLPERLDGMRVLDVGTWDGFWAFEMERRGAAEVVALDLDREQDLDFPAIRRPAEYRTVPRGRGFALAKEVLESKVERHNLSVYDATPEEIGSFDLVFCGSVIIHLRDPILAMERIAGLTRGTFVSVEAYNPWMNLLPFAAARYQALREASVVFWDPNVKAWEAILKTSGFDTVERKGRFKIKATAGYTVHHVAHHARFSSRT